jgi:hypothetical protein
MVPTPRRRWFQFSLAGLMAFVTAFSMLCGWLALKMAQKRKERAVVARVKELGGNVFYDSELQGEDHPGPAWLRRIVGDDFFDGVNSVQLFRDKQIDDRTMASLDLPTSIKTFTIFDMPIGDAGFARLKRLTALELLHLQRTEITDAALECMTDMERLEDLNLAESGITDEGLRSLAGFRNLRYLDLHGTNISDAGVACLKRMTNLVELQLHDTKITHRGGEELYLALPNCRVCWFMIRNQEQWAEYNELMGQIKTVANYHAALTDARREQRPDERLVAGHLFRLGSLLIEQGRFSEAQVHLHECLGIREKIDPNDWDTLATQSLMGAALAGQRIYEDAESLLLSSYERLKAYDQVSRPPYRNDEIETVERIVDLYDDIGQQDKAETWRKKLPWRRSKTKLSSVSE